MNIVQADPWRDLKQFTDARLGLGRCGVSIPLKEELAFRYDHACARDAVWTPVKTADMVSRLQDGLQELGVELDVLAMHSRAQNRQEYLMRPDYGRRLCFEATDELKKRAHDAEAHEFGRPQIALVLCDGLSSRAAEENGVPMMLAFVEALHKVGYAVGPVCLVEHGRVAVGDEIAQILGAKLVITMVGERPGLSSPDSLGIYMTYAPHVGITDEARNCISNVRPAGMSMHDAVCKLAYLVEKAFAMENSGVALKDDMPDGYLPFTKVHILE
ncbi:MAG: ethanolamine ammonia-lyase subunit EutC [Pseudomonadota bacterium]